MKVLYITNYQGSALCSSRGVRRNRALGGSRKVELLARALTARGHYVRILSFGTPAERSGRLYGPLREMVPAKTPVSVEYPAAWDVPVLNRATTTIGLVTRITRIAASSDVAIVYNAGIEQVLCAAACRMAGVPVVVEYEDDAEATLDRGAGSAFAGGRLLRRAMGTAASGALTVNERLKRQLGVGNSIAVNGIVPESYFDLPSREYRYPIFPFRVLYSGGLTTVKGVSLLLDAFPLLAPGAELTVCGQGPLLPGLLERARGLSHVRVLGEVSREILEHEILRAHLCVNPHLMSANRGGTLFPFKLAEYLASGACVVSSNPGDVPPEFESAVCWFREETPERLANAIDAVRHNYQEWRVKVDAARLSLRRIVGEAAVGEAIENLLNRALAE